MRAVAERVFAISLFLSLAVAASAQGNIRSITRIRLKPDRGGDWQAAVREYTGVLKKADAARGYTVWQSASGPSEYVLVAYFQRWADLDPMQDPKLKDVAADLARIFARGQQCTESTERILDEVQTDLSLPMTREVPKMVRVLRTRVRPGSVNDYMALIKSEILPAVKKAGLKTYLVSRARFGAPSSEFRSVTALNSWADLDGPPQISTAMGREAYQQFLAKLGPMLIASEYDVYRYQADLSYVPGGN